MLAAPGKGGTPVHNRRDMHAPPGKGETPVHN